MVTAELVCTRASAVDEENILYFTEIKLRACHLRNPFVTHSDTVVAHKWLHIVSARRVVFSTKTKKDSDVENTSRLAEMRC
jgi:hypothetical protein